MPKQDKQAGLDTYAELVRAWASKLDLVAPGDLERFEERHIEDCLRLAPLLPGLPPGPCVDVGSGAGLPGVVLAIVDPTRHWRLLEPRRRRAAFLEEVVRQLDLDCEVLALSAGAAAADPGLAGGHTLATARALAPPAEALALAEPLLAPGGAAAIFLGRGAEPPRSSEIWAEGIAIVRRD